MIDPRIIVLCVALVCSSSQGWAAERFPFLGEIASDKVSLRAGYNVNFERVDILSKGVQLVVLDKQYDWYKVQLPSSAKAYIRVDYVKLVNDQVGEISGNRLNIRAGRGVNFSALGQLNKGVYVRLVSKFDDWLQIEPVEGLYGWVHQDFIKVKSHTVPPLAQLGLAPVTVESKIAADATAPAAVYGGAPWAGVLAVTGIIETVPSSVGLKNIQYQFTTDDKAVYYLKVDPAVAAPFTRQSVRLEGEPVADAPASLAHPVVLVKKFNLVL